MGLADSGPPSALAQGRLNLASVRFGQAALQLHAGQCHACTVLGRLSLHCLQQGLRQTAGLRGRAALLTRTPAHTGQRGEIIFNFELMFLHLLANHELHMGSCSHVAQTCPTCGCSGCLQGFAACQAEGHAHQGACQAPKLGWQEGEGGKGGASQAET